MRFDTYTPPHVTYDVGRLEAARKAIGLHGPLREIPCLAVTGAGGAEAYLYPMVLPEECLPSRVAAVFFAHHMTGELYRGYRGVWRWMTIADRLGVRMDDLDIALRGRQPPDRGTIAAELQSLIGRCAFRGRLSSDAALRDWFSGRPVAFHLVPVAAPDDDARANALAERLRAFDARLNQRLFDVGRHDLIDRVRRLNDTAQDELDRKYPWTGGV